MLDCYCFCTHQEIKSDYFSHHWSKKIWFHRTTSSTEIHLCKASAALHNSVNKINLFFSEYLHCLPEICYWNMHGAIFVNVAKEIPQSQLALIQIILERKKE